ncbi:MAG: carbon-nitrogen hydrolase family protein [Desulfobulbaceae bacterium]|nr:MAG: carbon-nitrogen hydrolase family protein [Desulfobulbaceae bacterium]
MRIGIIQMNSNENKEHNLARARSMLQTLVEKGAEFVMLPEHFNFIGNDAQKQTEAEHIDDSLTRALLSQWAKTFGIYLHSGSFLEREGENIYNASYVFDPSGETLAHYRKIHLFDVEVEGGIQYRESDTVTGGSRVVTFDAAGYTFGMATCYDLRFPELFRTLLDRGSEVLLIPAAFTVQTGRDHWQLLLRARAVENLCWVLAANQWGPSAPHNYCYGRSMVVDPWGTVIGTAVDGEQTLLVEIDRSIITERRKSFPATEHRRPELFQYG